MESLNSSINLPSLALEYLRYSDKASAVVCRLSRVEQSYSRFVKDQNDLLAAIAEWSACRQGNLPLLQFARHTESNADNLLNWQKDVQTKFKQARMQFQQMINYFYDLQGKVYNYEQARKVVRDSQNQVRSLALNLPFCRDTWTDATVMEKLRRQELIEYLLDHELGIIVKLRKAMEALCTAAITTGRTMVAVYGDVALATQASLPSTVVDYTNEELEELFRQADVDCTHGLALSQKESATVDSCQSALTAISPSNAAVQDRTPRPAVNNQSKPQRKSKGEYIGPGQPRKDIVVHQDKMAEFQNVHRSPRRQNNANGHSHQSMVLQYDETNVRKRQPTTSHTVSATVNKPSAVVDHTNEELEQLFKQAGIDYKHGLDLRQKEPVSLGSSQSSPTALITPNAVSQEKTSRSAVKNQNKSQRQKKVENIGPDRLQRNIVSHKDNKAELRNVHRSPRGQNNANIISHKGTVLEYDETHVRKRKTTTSPMVSATVHKSPEDKANSKTEVVRDFDTGTFSIDEEDEHEQRSPLADQLFAINNYNPQTVVNSPTSPQTPLLSVGTATLDSRPSSPVQATEVVKSQSQDRTQWFRKKQTIHTKRIHKHES